VQDALIKDQQRQLEGHDAATARRGARVDAGCQGRHVATRAAAAQTAGPCRRAEAGVQASRPVCLDTAEAGTQTGHDKCAGGGMERHGAAGGGTGWHGGRHEVARGGTGRHRAPQGGAGWHRALQGGRGLTVPLVAPLALAGVFATLSRPRTRSRRQGAWTRNADLIICSSAPHPPTHPPTAPPIARELPPAATIHYDHQILVVKFERTLEDKLNLEEENGEMAAKVGAWWWLGPGGCRWAEAGRSGARGTSHVPHPPSTQPRLQRSPVRALRQRGAWRTSRRHLNLPLNCAPIHSTLSPLKAPKTPVLPSDGRDG
jgi:hypothetical protein